jgi:hypothetical protein
MARPRGSLVVQMLVLSERRALPFPGYRKAVARYNPGQDNKSLDASGVSGLLIHNLSVAQLLAAASTQPLGRLSALTQEEAKQCLQKRKH